MTDRVGSGWLGPGPTTGALGEAIDRLWDVFGDRTSLFSVLDSDAVLARAHAGEVRGALPRLMELIVADAVSPADRIESFDLLSSEDVAPWSRADRSAIERFADTWWRFTLETEQPAPPVDAVLACLVRLDAPLIRWLSRWLDELDGPAAHHLARTVIDGLDDPGWADHDDEREQILGWARTEPVVLGLTVVGGVHLDEGELSEALDRML